MSHRFGAPDVGSVSVGRAIVSAETPCNAVADTGCMNVILHALAAAALQSSASLCITCHGTHGEGSAAIGAPRLAGLNAEYLRNELSELKSGKRSSATMQPIARSLGDAQIGQLADYFSKQDAPPADVPAPASPALVLAGKRLAETGAPDVAACFTCHAAQGQGSGAHFPSIAGQPARYVVDRLHQFQARARDKAPPPGTMMAVAAAMSETQVEEAAAYLAQLAPLPSKSD
jgi:cytochrome c553